MIDWSPVVAALAAGITALFAAVVGYIAVRTGQTHSMVNGQHTAMMQQAKTDSERIQTLEHQALPVVPPQQPTP